MQQPTVERFLSIYESIVKSREVDLLEQDYTQRGEAFFHVSGTGHENIAFLNPHLTADDYLHCHYRDKALLIDRGISPYQFFLSLFCKDGSHSRGRQMSAHLSDPALKVLSLVGPVGNNALQAVGVASVIKEQPSRPLVVCALGDGTTQQGEVLEAIAHAVREHLPVLFVVEDNTWAISTKTKGQTFYSRPSGDAQEFYGLPLLRVDGRDPVASYETFGRAVEGVREHRGPAIVIFQVSRLNSHTNADDHRSYRSLEEIEETRRRDDPLPRLEAWLEHNGVALDRLAELRARLKDEVQADSLRAQDSAEPEPIYTAKADLPSHLTNPAEENTGVEGGEQITMLEALREVLRHRLETDPAVSLFGEDIEDPKGDVFGVTKGLSEAFPGRVKNSPLAESTIVGVSVGQALAGRHPVGFLQFADFFAIAYNQIFAEMGSMHWRTDGGWKAPMILMVSCGGYKPGLGPFHASSMESIAAHTPGLDVFLPATAGDAAGLLNAAFESKRPTVFFYPKSCLNDRTQATSKDIRQHLVPIGRGRLHRHGDQLTLVGWGNTLNLCLKAADALAAAGKPCDVIDLRSLSPWDEPLVLESVRKTGRLIIAQEDSHSASMASEIAATVAEKAGVPVQIRRVARPDTYVPCNFGNQLEVLPSYKKILTTAVDLFGGELTWELDLKIEAGFAFVEAVGSSPSDESVTVLEWLVKPGQKLTPGLKLAELEADKAAFDLSSPLEGTLAEVLVPVGEQVKVGTPLLKVATGSARVSKKPITLENPGTPHIVWLDTGAQSQPTHRSARAPLVGVAGIRIAPGSRTVTNEEIAALCPDWTPAGIVKRIGIHTRQWATDDETALSLAVRASRELLDAHKLAPEDLTAVFCTTGTPASFTPSMACLVLAELTRGRSVEPLIQVNDINAACSGYLYSLQAAWDHLAYNPNGRVLVITTEVLSRRTDHTDVQTAPVFGDAATASLVVGADRAHEILAEFDRPVLSGRGEDGSSLKVPLSAEEFISMDGPKVYLEAVKHMVLLLEQACHASGMAPHDLDLVVAHQANQRILNAVRQKTKLTADRIFSNIGHFGNTSSNSIPLALFELTPELVPGKVVGLCAFGGGFTFGGAVMRTR
ncbi:MAG: thiamine pyrophosphate-dependent enzyme [Spirochaetales bacterium]